MIITTGLLAILLTGCDMLREQSSDPNSPMSQGVTAIDAVARGIQQTAPAAGPYGWIVGAVATIVTGAAGAYKVRQKNQTISTDGKIITAQQREFAMVRDTTKAIVEAIEQVGEIKMTNGNTIGTTIKAQVSEELKKRNLDVIGKAVISGIKAAQEKPKDAAS
jgi:hypothetical protein